MNGGYVFKSGFSKQKVTMNLKVPNHAYSCSCMSFVSPDYGKVRSKTHVFDPHTIYM